MVVSIEIHGYHKEQQSIKCQIKILKKKNKKQSSGSLMYSEVYCCHAIEIKIDQYHVLT